MSLPQSQLIQAGRFLFNQGWSPATSSNYSLRIDDQILITVSGRHKGKLTEQDFLRLNLEGEILHQYQPQDRPSAETLLHLNLYQQFKNIRAVLHTHSVNATVISRLLKTADHLKLQNYELQKAFAGISTHETECIIPIVDNDQDMVRLNQKVSPLLQQHPSCPGYLIRGHGLYAWGKDLEEALRHVEALEFLFACELALMRRT